MPECDTRIRPPATAPLIDATPAFDQFVVAALTAAQTQPNGEGRADAVYQLIGAPATLDPTSHDFNKTRIEIFGDSQPANVVYPPGKPNTKYADVRYGVWPKDSDPNPRVLSPTLLIGDIAIGLDKIGHFAQQGYEYYRQVRRAGRQLRDAEAWGLQTETHGMFQVEAPYLAHYGLTTTGVLSRADLVANKAGYDFYTWVEQTASTAFTFRNYVTPQWNEETNTSYYHQDIWQTVWNKLITGTWTASVTRPNNQTSNVTFTLTATGNTLSGRYTYTDGDGIAHAGAVSGTIVPVIRHPQGPVGGVHVAMTWTRGDGTGRAFLSSARGEPAQATEHMLCGTWGFGDSRNNGGRMDLTRV